MDFKVEMKGLSELIRDMDALHKNQVPYATMLAVNKTIEEALKEIKNKMPSFIDRPTAWTMNGMFIKYATKKNLSAEFGYKDKTSIRVTTKNKGTGTPAAEYLSPNVEGGARNLKRFERMLNFMGVLPNGFYIVPGAACQLDAYGNITQKYLKQILSYFNSAEKSSGYKANTPKEKKEKMKKGTKRKIGYSYFVSYGSGPQGPWNFGLREGRQHLKPGIYIKYAGSIGPGQIRPVMMFVRRPSYQKRFPFYDITQRIIEDKLVNNFNEAMDEAIKTAR